MNENEISMFLGIVSVLLGTFAIFQSWKYKNLGDRLDKDREQMQLFNRILDKNNKQFCDDMFLDLADDAFEGMEILLAPKISEAEYIMVEALLEKYCKGNKVKLEKSRIRVK